MISMTFTGPPFLKSCRFLQLRPPKPTLRFRTIHVCPKDFGPRLAAQSTTSTISILMPLWSRSEQIKVQAIPGLIGQYGDVP